MGGRGGGLGMVVWRAELAFRAMQCSVRMPVTVK